MIPAFLLEYKIHCLIFRFGLKLKQSVKLFSIILLFGFFTASAQLPVNEQQFLSRLKVGEMFPEKLLSTRTVVFHPYTMNAKELEMCQKSFQRTGIDAVAYFEADLTYAGRDAVVSLAEYLNKREITNLVYFQKYSKGYTIYITEYNKKANLVEEQQNAWFAENKNLEQLLLHVYRTTANSLKNENFLINDVPESGFAINAIDGNRNEFFAIDLKVDALAVPKFGNEQMDKELEEIMKAYPYKYTLTEATLSEAELRKAGFLYVLRFSHARNKTIRSLFGYETTRSQSAIVSMTYVNDQPQLKNIHANEEVWKFYFKHIESKNVFLGRKWDADPSWQQALWNQLKGYKDEFKLN
jgi:hypothetical protein